MTFNIEGYGYEWDAELVGGPADGCIDRVIQVNGEVSPPLYFTKMIDENPKRESLGEKLIEHWAIPYMVDETKVAVYKLRDKDNIDNQDLYQYDYIKTTTLGEFKKHYDK